MASEDEFDIVVIGGGPGGYAAALYGAAAGTVGGDRRARQGRRHLPAPRLYPRQGVPRDGGRATGRGARRSSASTSGRDAGLRPSARNASRRWSTSSGKGCGPAEGASGHHAVGTGTLREGRRVEVLDGPDAGRVLTGRNVVLAPGSVPHAAGLRRGRPWVLTSDEFLDLEKLPASVVVIGGGVMGCEFASLLADLGAKVTVLEALDAICRVRRRHRPARGALVQEGGIDIMTGARWTGTRRRRRHGDDGEGGRAVVDVEAVVVSVGRRPRTEGLVADGVGVLIDERGFVVADEYQRTGGDGVWAVGDIVAGTPQLAHVGFAEAIVGDEGHAGRAGGAGRQLPGALGHLLPPRGRVLRHDRGAGQGAGIDVVVKKDPFGGNSRAQIIGDTEGVVKIVAEQRPDGTAGTDPRRAHGRAVGHRAAGRRVPRRQLGGDSPTRSRSSSSRTPLSPRRSARPCWP